jgi:hypothetical protein
MVLAIWTFDKRENLVKKKINLFSVTYCNQKLVEQSETKSTHKVNLPEIFLYYADTCN